MNENEMSFGEYLEFIRRSRRKSMRQTAKAIGVSPQFYSEVHLMEFMNILIWINCKITLTAKAHIVISAMRSLIGQLKQDHKMI